MPRSHKLIKGEPDARDPVFNIPSEAAVDDRAPTPMFGTRTRRRGMSCPLSSQLPLVFDLRTTVKENTTSLTPPILDQGEIGACGANELSNALRYCLAKQEQDVFQPSRLFIYYFARLLDGSTLTDDVGITIKNGLEAINRFGVPPETINPYDISKHHVCPSKEAFAAAKEARMQGRALTYKSVPQDLLCIQHALKMGFPVLLGIQIYDSMESADTLETGMVRMPAIAKESNLGAHCVSLWGWDGMSRSFLMMNTWGESVGKQGWFTIPYEYVLDPNLAFDLWTIQKW